MPERVYITRGTQGEIVNGQPRQARVYITGPHFGCGVYASTEHRADATTFSRAEAERLLALGKWRDNLPEIEEADHA